MDVFTRPEKSTGYIALSPSRYVVTHCLTIAVTLMKTIFLFLSITLMLLHNSSVFAQAEEITKQRAVEIATQSYPGQVLSVKRKANVYKVKTLSDTGKVRIIMIDAQSGKIEPGQQAEQ